ncbi:MAG: alkaline phosphatase family protein [Alistipes sp.]|nr:alkaline phosphatase family protein [Alistipes sp.]
MKKLALLLLALAGTASALSAAEPPRLIVNIVVGSLRADDIDRYREQFGTGGFLRLEKEGLRFTECTYDYQQTATPVSLTTFATGAQPATHGVIGLRWRDYVQNRVVGLIDDAREHDPEYHNGHSAYSPRNLVAPTLGETLAAQRPGSRAVSIAMEASSAIPLGGREGWVFWMDGNSCNWTTSTYYLKSLPAWVKSYNGERPHLAFASDPWRSLLNEEKYRNRRRSDIILTAATGKRRTPLRPEEYIRRISSIAPYRTRYDNLLYTPAGNSLVLEFARTAVTQLEMGKREAPDLLNICLDASRAISEAYGPESIEAEDMLCRLDRDLAEFIDFLQAQVAPGQLLVLLTSDHGTSPSYDLCDEEAERFNARQFEVIVNGFLSARYGAGQWVLEYEDKNLYLNHNLIYEHKLALADVQNETAAFALQFRGISHALSATALRSAGFGSGYARKMQNGYYPRRSGDVVINLMPGWIEEHPARRSASGSMYRYDTHVPLLFYGGAVAPGSVARPIDMTSVAPTLARLLRIEAPAASEGPVLEEVVANR